VDEYLNEFQDLIMEASYSDPKTIVVKLRRGLDTQIQNAIAAMPSGRPSDMVSTDWYTAAVKLGIGIGCRVRSRVRRWLQLVGCAALLMDALNFGDPDGVGESRVELRRSLRKTRVS